LLVSYTASQAVSIVQSNHGHSIANRLGRLFFHLEISLFDSVSSWEITKSLIQQDLDLKYIIREGTIHFSEVCIIASMELAIDRADIPLEEPLTTELELEVKSQLEEYWKFHRRDLTFRRNTKLSWLATEKMITLDEATPQLKPKKTQPLLQ
jgi:hypothetical protein